MVVSLESTFQGKFFGIVLYSDPGYMEVAVYKIVYGGTVPGVQFMRKAKFHDRWDDVCQYKLADNNLVIH